MNTEWMAGFFDGEGSVIIALKKPCTTFLYCRVGNTCLDALKVFHKAFGGCLNGPYQAKHRRPIYQWCVSYGGAEKFLEAMLPHLVVKKLQAKLGLDYQAFKRLPHRRNSEKRLKAEVRFQEKLFRSEMHRMNWGL